MTYREGYDYRGMLGRMQEPFALFKLSYDAEGSVVSYTLEDMNDAYADLLGIIPAQVKGKRVEAILHLRQPPFLTLLKKVALEGGSKSFTRYYAALGKTFKFSVTSKGDGFFTVLMLDLSHQVTLEQKMHDLVYRDPLTGMYNRRYYKETIPFFVQSYNFPLTVILIDINALKLANDAFGHETGDELIRRLSGMIRSCLKDDAWAARIGGDEFVILIPRMDSEEGQKCMKKMSCDAFKTQVNHVNLSFSFGVATMREGMDYDVVYKRAENQLYTNKLKTAAEVKRKMLFAVEKTLYEKAPWKKTHVERVRNLSVQFARALGFSEEEQHKVALTARFHDIGKTAINKKILNKQACLTSRETLELNRHPEIGYRIMSALNSYSEVAEYILHHHESVDGTGYPLGVSKEAIPLISRILRITEAYDAMVSSRPDNPGLLPHAAQVELLRKKGQVFDEDLVDIFLRRIVPLEDTLSVLSDALVIERGHEGVRKIGFAKHPVKKPKQEDALVKDARNQIEAYLKGKRLQFDFPLEFSGTDFQKEVYRIVQHIPYGEVWTYGDIAKHLKRPNAARAVGNALNRNALALVVPCHRVVGSDGQLVGYASGLPLKKALLCHETINCD